MRGASDPARLFRWIANQGRGSMSSHVLLWLILFAPLAACAIITVFTRRNREASAGISIAAAIFAFILSLTFVVGIGGWSPGPSESALTWLDIGDLKIQFGLRLDGLSVLMMVVVSGVASAIHIYSWGYMRDDPGFSRFFAC